MHVPVLFIIPARAGSQGVPGKNYLELYGKPLVWWSIEAARRSTLDSEIVVSTNDPKIIDIANSFNEEHGENTVRVVERPDGLSGSSAKTEEAMSHAIAAMTKKRFSFDYICLLQPTSPARPDKLIDRCFKKIIDYRAESLLTVSEHTPFFWRYQDGGARSVYPNNKRKMRQELATYEMYYHDNGNIYIIEADKFNWNGRISERPVLYKTSKFESMQIDSHDDFALMEMAANYYGKLI